MSIDFNSPDVRVSYLSEKLDGLLDGINESYGTVLLDELILRLEHTISEFNNEVKELMDCLKANTEKKEELLEKIKSGEFGTSDQVEEETVPPRELSEWEKRLEKIDKK